MAAKIVGQVWELQLPAPKQIVLLAMADHADHTGGSVRPGVPLIAWKTGYSERQVQRIIHNLEADGLLAKVRVRQGKPTEYRIDLEKGVKKSPYVPREMRVKTGDNMTPVKMSSVTSHEKQEKSGGDMPRRKTTRVRHKEEPSKEALKFSKNELDAAWDAIRSAWKTENAGLVTRYRSFMFGMGKRKGEWDTFAPTTPTTPEELGRFAIWACAKMHGISGKAEMPTKPETIARWLEEFRAIPAPAHQQPVVVVVDAPTAPAMVTRSPEERAAMVRAGREQWQKAAGAL